MTTSIKDQPERWEAKWAAGNTGWDLGRSHPALTRLLASDKVSGLGLPSQGRALIPGCGLGYDVLTFARRGLSATGLDISPTGAEAARKWLDQNTSDDQSLKEHVNVTRVNFFEYEVESEKKYDLIYDYTFLCAIEPHLRPQWSKQMTALSRPSPETRLITLMFPLNGKSGGPPFNLTEEVYHELLDEDWELVWSEEVPEEERRRGNLGGETMAVWKRRA